MTLRHRGAAWAIAGILAGGTMGAAAQPVPTAAGVAYEPAITLENVPLVLNGAGVRYKAVFQVYAAGLYLERKVSTAEEAMSLQGRKRVSITMLRDIDSTELGKLFSRGIEDNLDKATFSRLVPGVLRMGQIFSAHRKLSAGDRFTVDWIPGTGTVITVKGAAQGEPFREPEFFGALLGIWLGPQPADWKLKEALLGHAR
ncbi:chalcone isomerase family protein [Acidovorax sp. GBBC 3334]|uniref:chalcone isomerase family protein n=1 Tax=Acidovorax sp. GBBC 3334 TaxID=2940496 RepID=UPI002302EDFE|nr:chalcone isomerase family protein [Acidovorax sp. GBBC 3334]MDA8457334.1 chalcone isomerase family protein [Acidovorax sp. GBBC 3334]